MEKVNDKLIRMTKSELLEYIDRRAVAKARQIMEARSNKQRRFTDKDIHKAINESIDEIWGGPDDYDETKEKDITVSIDFDIDDDGEAEDTKDVSLTVSYYPNYDGDGYEIDDINWDRGQYTDEENEYIEAWLDNSRDEIYKELGYPTTRADYDDWNED